MTTEIYMPEGKSLWAYSDIHKLLTADNDICKCCKPNCQRYKLSGLTAENHTAWLWNASRTNLGWFASLNAAQTVQASWSGQS